MNNIRSLQTLTDQEISLCVPPNASWHRDFADTAYVFIGGLPFTLSEGDVLTIFSQYGEPTHIKLARDQDTGKSKGFAFLKYEDQRSTDLAVDNLNGAVIAGRVIKVDHTRYKRKEEDDGMLEVGFETVRGEGEGSDGDEGQKGVEDRPVFEEERELMRLEREMDEEDPMKEYLVKEKREEVNKAIQRWREKKAKTSRGDGRKDVRPRRIRDGEERKHRHRHRSGRDGRRSSSRDHHAEKDRAGRRERESSHIRSRSRSPSRERRRSRERRHKERSPR